MKILFKFCDIKNGLRQKYKLSQVSFGSKSPEGHFEPYQTSVMERFCRNI